MRPAAGRHPTAAPQPARLPCWLGDEGTGRQPRRMVAAPGPEWRSSAARWAHNPQVPGSNPGSGTRGTPDRQVLSLPLDTAQQNHPVPRRLPRVKHVGLRGSSVAERGHASPSVPGSSPGRVRRLREASTARNHSGRWKAHRTPKCATRASGGTGRRARLKSGCPVRGVRVRIPPGPRDTEGQVPGVQARQRACAERATGGPHGVVHQRAGGGVEALPGFGPEGVTLLRNRGLQGPQPRG